MAMRCNCANMDALLETIRRWRTAYALAGIVFEAIRCRAMMSGCGRGNDSWGLCVLLPWSFWSWWKPSLTILLRFSSVGVLK